MAVAVGVTTVGFTSATAPTPRASAPLEDTPVDPGTEPPAIVDPAIQTLLDERVPARSSQAVLVSGDADNGMRLVAVSRWQRGSDGIWTQVGRTARGHVGGAGWGKQRLGDMKTPVGTFTLTAAGGYLPAPAGTRLPYDYRPERYLKPGSRFADYVVRINWNVRKVHWSHVPADTPSRNEARGNGIWLHADSRYDTPTAGCVSQPRPAMRATLRWLDPALNPVIVLAPGPLLVPQPWE